MRLDRRFFHHPATDLKQLVQAWTVYERILPKMCDQITVLARLDHRRWINCCEHDTSLLNWDNVSVRIPLPRLRAMGKALRECAQVARHFRIAGTDEVCVIFDQHDLYQVWLGGVGLCLSPDEFQNFCHLVATACAHPTAHARVQKAAIPISESLIRTTYHLFSMN